MRKLLFCTLLTAIAASVSPAQTVRGIKTFIAMGDSIGEGVQSGDSNSATQPNSYLKLVASRLRVPFPLPLIATSPIATVESTNHRSRIVPSTQSPNLAVSGADTGSALTDQADGVVNEEVDLVLSPRLGAQIDVAETTPSDLMIYWLGNNDALSAILAFDHLDASQLTPVNVFYANLDEGLRRLKAAGKTKVVVGNLINIPQIAFSFDATQLRAFAGSDFGLAPGSRTSLIAALLLRSGIAPANLLQSPNWVLNANELATIQSRIDSFNAIIAERAAFYGYPVVDVKAAFDAYLANPPIVAGVPVTNRFNGGMFSLDGVHPSNTGHALVANLFLATINQAYGLTLAPYSQSELDTIGASDPFLDLDGDGVVRGRPLKGLFETIGPFFGVSGDTESPVLSPAARRGNAQAALARYHQLMGISSPQGTPMEQAVRMFKQIVSWSPKLQ